ncbi:hypothetical protein MTO96_012371 [Rhipicephalus appendiculatus]
MEELREDEYCKSHGQPQQKLRAESTSESRPGASARFLDGLGNNKASSVRENHTPLFMPHFRWQPGLPANKLPAPFKFDDLSVTEASSNTKVLRDGEYLRSQGQPGEDLHVESTSENQPEESAEFLDGFCYIAASSKPETSTSLSRLLSRSQSEHSAPEPPVPSKLDDLSVTEAMPNAEGLREGEYIRLQGQPEQELDVERTYKSLLKEAVRILHELGNHAASSQRETSTALTEPYSRKRSESSAPEPPVPSEKDVLKPTETPSNTEELCDGKCLRSQPQPLLDDQKTCENQSKKADNFDGELNDTVLLQRKISASLDKPSSLHQSEPLATETMEIPGKSIIDGKHFSDVEQPCQKTYAEALKQPGMTLTTAEACNIHIDTRRVTWSERSDCYEAHKSAFHRTPGTFSKEEPVRSTMPNERKMSSKITSGKMDRSPLTHEKGKTIRDRNAKENNTTAKYSRAGGMSVKTIPNKSDPHLERILSEHHTQAPESRSTKSGTSQRTSSHEESVFWNSSRNSQHSRSGSAQQRRSVIEQGRSRYASSTAISRTVIESARQPSGIPCDTSNAETEHKSAVSGMRAPDQKILYSSLVSSRCSEEGYVLEEGHKVSISTESKREHDAVVVSPAEGTRRATREDALTSEARDVELASTRVQRPCEEVTAIASAPGFSQRQNYSADHSAFGAAYEASSYRPNNDIVVGSGFQIDIACSQEIPSSRTSRAFSCPADIPRQGTPDLHIRAAYRSAKHCNGNREQAKEHHGSVLNSRESLQNDSSYVLETEV